MYPSLCALSCSQLSFTNEILAGDTADAEIMSPSVENSKQSYILSVKPGRVGQNIASYASPTARNVFMCACVRGSGDGARVYLCVHADVFAYIYMFVNFPTTPT